ncbi:hypothetical protein OH77DRAFT_1594212 [Trametes cingulata]|nr:hypothetical protein OH77DRAFT_1594212 [Trametes cingulata]
MHLYNLTVQPPTAITDAIVGNFSCTRQQEVLVSRGTRLELLRVDPHTGKLSTVVASDVFGSVRSLAAFRLAGDLKDYIAVGSDSGRIVILEYDPQTNSFVKVHEETYGKSGVRRIVPGQYLAADPKGRALMISAMEKSKLVYILSRDANHRLAISSPLEARTDNTIIHHVVGLDVGYDNPTFAVLEVDYTEADKDPTGEAFRRAQKMLTYYELDLGLNHVVRKWSAPTDRRANLLVQVPGGQATSSDRYDGPSGVLVCCEDHVIYQHMDAPPHRVPIPRRNYPFQDKERGLLINAAVMHRMKDAFFFLLQSEEGDLYKVTIQHEEQEGRALKIKYFDTVPVASSLCILKSGFLFVAAEFGNHHLYQFLKLGEEDDTPQYSSTDYPRFGMADPKSPLPHACFRPHALENLSLVDELESLNPIIDSKVLSSLPSATGAPQIFAACGRGPQSTLRILHHGLEVDEAIHYNLRGTPTSVWTTKLREEDHFDAYIVLSFNDATLVLSIGETITEADDSGFLTTSPTIAVQQVGADGLLQVHPNGIRHILADKRVNEWRVPHEKSIVTATTNNRQIVAALSSGELMYFELDLEGQFNECQERKVMGSNILSLSIGEVPTGRLRTPYLAVGCEDQTVRILSLDPDNTLEVLGMQALSAPPSSICIVEMLNTTFVNIGLRNGVLLRTVLDSSNGQLTDSRLRFLGTRPVELVRVSVNGNLAVLALSSRSWLNYTYQNEMHFTPLIYENLDSAWTFSSELLTNGFVGVSGSVLRLFRDLKLGTKLTQDIISLDNTPRKFVAHPTNALLYLVEGDHRAYSTSAAEIELEKLHANGASFDRDILELPQRVFGRPKAPAGTWKSCIRVIDPAARRTVHVIELDNNEAAFSIAVVQFAARDNELHLVVGTAQDTLLSPASCTSGFLRTYRLLQDGGSLELVHKTEIDDIPHALLGFHGVVAAGVGKSLRLYELGHKQLLRKAENKARPNFTTTIVTLNAQGSRLLVGDMQESIHYVVYKPIQNRLLIFADDTQPRWITTTTMLDYHTVVAGDRFGNIFVNRLDPNVSSQVDDDPVSARIMHEKGVLMGAPHKTTLLAHFHVGDIITGLHKVSMVAGAPEVILYTGLHGTIGVLVPLISKEDVDFTTILEQHLRAEQLSLVGRDHLAWRGYYVPVKAVVDGDLCEMYARLPPHRRGAVAGELDRTVGEVLKKLEQLRVTAAGF